MEATRLSAVALRMRRRLSLSLGNWCTKVCGVLFLLALDLSMAWQSVSSSESSAAFHRPCQICARVFTRVPMTQTTCRSQVEEFVLRVCSRSKLVSWPHGKQFPVLRVTWSRQRSFAMIL